MVHDTKTTSEVRSNFSSYVAQVTENPYTRIFFGNHRKAEAVLRSSHADVPDNVLGPLLTAAACQEAELIIREYDPKSPYPRIGDSAGTILAWLWQFDPDRAVMFLADIVAELRHHNSRAPKKPRIKLSEILDVIDGAMPSGFPSTELATLRAKAAVDVPDILREDSEVP